MKCDTVLIGHPISDPPKTSGKYSTNLGIKYYDKSKNEWRIYENISGTSECTIWFEESKDVHVLTIEQYDTLLRRAYLLGQKDLENLFHKLFSKENDIQ